MCINLNVEPCISGFRGARRDATMRVQLQSAGPCSEEGDYSDPCPEDEEFFTSGPDAEVMEEATSKFMDGIEAQERGGLKDLHRCLGRLPVPTGKESQGMTHTEEVLSQ